ncbi:MAG TPA: putative Ig domain-containing protein, partial [Candidatus Methylomirabilis sp.]|nr:putative Ig domain-containing protein [Candidatus Methylomirabilis sp.]
LPKGLKLSGTGVLSGTPSTKLAGGSSSITVTATEKVTTLNGAKKVKTKKTVQVTIPLNIS